MYNSHSHTSVYFDVKFVPPFLYHFNQNLFHFIIRFHCHFSIEIFIIASALSLIGITTDDRWVFFPLQLWGEINMNQTIVPKCHAIAFVDLLSNYFLELLNWMVFRSIIAWLMQSMIPWYVYFMAIFALMFSFMIPY